MIISGLPTAPMTSWAAPRDAGGDEPGEPARCISSTRRGRREATSQACDHRAADDDRQPSIPPRETQARMSTGPVLCAFDASEPSILAAHTAAWLAEALDAPLELVTVIDTDDLPALPPRGAGLDPLVRDALPEIQDQIAEDAARAELEAALS